MIKVLVKNIKFMAVNKTVNMLYSLIFFPFIIHYVGKEMYGAYLLVLAISGYLSLFDMGIGSATVKYVAEFNAKEDEKSVNAVINSSFTFYILIAAVIALTLFAFSFCFDSVFKIAEANRQIARKLFWAAGLTALVYWPNFLFRNVLVGLQRYEWSSMGDIALVLCNAIAACILFPRGGTIADFQFIGIAIIAVIFAFYFVKTKDILKGFHLTFPYLEKNIYKTTFKYGIILFLSGLVSMVIFQIGNFVVGAFISVAAVTMYGVAFSMQQNVRSLNSVIGSPFVPASAELHGRDDTKAQRDIFLKGTRFSAALFVPIVVISIVFAKAFIVNWMGPSFSDSVLPARILLAFWAFNGTIDIGASILTGKGIVRIFLWISSICAILTVVISLVLARPLNLVGVALGLTLPMIFVNFPLTLYFLLKNLKVEFAEFYKTALKNNLIFYAAVAVISLVAKAAYCPRNIYLTILEMLVIYAACAFLYYGLFLKKNERAVIRGLLI